MFLFYKQIIIVGLGLGGQFEKEGILFLNGNGILEKIHIFCFLNTKHVVEDVLLRLPIRSLLRFKALSKDVCSLISSPEFITLHHQISKTNPSSIIRSSDSIFASEGTSSFFLRRNGTRLLQVLDPGWYHRVVQLVGCANGLVCVELAFCGSSRRTFTLWNPATKQYRHIWYPSWKPDDCSIVGFGYHGGIKDYKLFAMAPFQARARVISLRQCTPRDVDTRGRPLLRTNAIYGQGVVVKGVWYRVLDTDGGPIVFSFDLEDDSFAVIDFPLMRHSLINGVELCVRNDEQLCFYATGYPGDQCHGWTLMGGGASSWSWARTFTTDYPIPYLTPLRIWPRLRKTIFSFLEERNTSSNGLLFMLWDYYNPEYFLDVFIGNFLWDPLTPSSEKIPKTIEGLHLMVHEMYGLVESLVSPFLLEI